MWLHIGEHKYTDTRIRKRRTPNHTWASSTVYSPQGWVVENKHSLRHGKMWFRCVGSKGTVYKVQHNISMTCVVEIFTSGWERNKSDIMSWVLSWSMKTNNGEDQMAFKPSRANMVIIYRYSELAATSMRCLDPSQSLIHRPELLLEYLLDISGCEVTLFMCSLM